MNRNWIVSVTMLVLSSISHAKVTVKVNGEQHNYEERPRLTEVLQPYALQQRWYWPAAALYRIDSQRAEHIRRDLVVLGEEILQQTDDTALQDALKLLLLQVNQWQLAERIFIPLDYDAASVQVSLNPLFDAGSYSVMLKRRPTMVHIAGAVSRSVSVPHNSASHVKVYLQEEQFSHGADRSRVAVVQPDGRVIIAGTESWNSEHVEAMPGAQLLVLFAEPLLDKRFATLNNLLQQLAVHRIFP
ncbi:capsule biosynthesis GfcC family protein [Rheinheimera sp. FR7-31]|uniref:capsule biosynthesis GfcC family protein n=1 Tax=Rheinheimera fenheensis TaxID=3152295 RepID=UPI00325C5757